MIKAVFFDLDGTLLPNDRKEFESSYFKVIYHTFKDYSNVDLIVNTVIESIKVMAQNNGPNFNEQVFKDYFISKVNDYPYQHYDDCFTNMYQTSFQRLKDVCGIEDKANELLQLVKRKNKKVILATTPLFPYIATESRIKWANIDPGMFDLITTYENSIGAKPNPYYYSWLLSKLDLNSDEVIMVGNDCLEDGAAKKCGIKTYIIDRNIEHVQYKDNMDFVGNIQQVIDKLEREL